MAFPERLALVSLRALPMTPRRPGLLLGLCLPASVRLRNEGSVCEAET